MRNFFKLLLESLKGEENNFTTGNINKAIFMLAVPAVLEMSLEALFAIVDVTFVARIGTDAVAVVGLTESVLTLIYSVAWGFSTAATAVIARRIGENRTQDASYAAGQVIVLSVIVAVLIGVPGFIFAENILQLMGASPSVIAQGLNFTRIMFVSTPVIVLLYTLCGVLRGAGNGSLAMQTLAVSNLANIILDPIFIFGLSFIPSFGVVGAAIATSTGRTLGVLFQLRQLTSGNGVLHIKSADLRPNFSVIWNLCKMGMSNTAQFLVGSASWVFLARIIASFGSEVVAGYTIAIRIVIFTILPAWGMANAAATLVGQNLGASQPDRAATSAWRASFYNMAFLGLVMVVFLFFAPELVGFFTDNPLSIKTGVEALQIFSLGYVFYAFGMVLIQAFNGAGDTLTPLILNIIGFWIVEIPLAYYLANYTSLQTMGVYISVAFSESLMAVLAIIMFKRGKWKIQKV
jgi:putative MATE family efflux protein